MNIDIISFVLGVLLGAGAGFVFLREKWAAQTQVLRDENARLQAEAAHDKESLEQQKNLLEETRKQMSDHFKALSAEVAKDSQKNFLTLAEESFKRLQENAQGDLEKREAAIKTLVDPVSKSLEKMDEKIATLEKARANAYGELKEHLRNMRDDQERLRSETASLSQALRSSSTRGQWGEMQLKRTLEMAGLVEGVHYERQVTVAGNDGRQQRPDVIIKIPGDKQIVIDSKAPIESYLESFKDGVSPSEREAALDRHARHVKTHIKDLGSKAYWQQFDTPELVVMFLPGENYLPAALDRDPSLLDYAFDSKVMPTSPTTLVPLLKSIAYGWQQEKLAENAREISALGNDLYRRLITFGGHLDKIGKGISSAIDGYNKAVGSFSARVLPAARKFQELQNMKADDKLSDMPQIEKTPHAAPDLSEEEPVKAVENG